MPTIECPYEGCDWKSENVDAAFASVVGQQLAMHDRAKHSNPMPTPKPQSQKLNIDPPKINVGASPERQASMVHVQDWHCHSNRTSSNSTVLLL